MKLAREDNFHMFSQSAITDCKYYHIFWMQ